MSEKPEYHQSDLNSFEFCAYAYYLQSIEGRRGLGNFYSCRGNSCHVARKVNLRQKVKSMNDLPVDEIADAACDEIRRLFDEEKIDLKTDELKGLGKKLAVGKVIDNTIPLVRLDRRQLQTKISPAYVEHTIRAKLENLPFDLCGTIDLITTDKWLVDLKTSINCLTQKQADEGYQASLYILLQEAMLGERPAGIVLHVLQAGKKTNKAYEVTTMRTQKQIESALRRMLAMHEAIQAGIFSPCRVDHWKCSAKWCGFYRGCKYVQK